MAEGDFGDLLWAFQYHSQAGWGDPAVFEPMGAADAKYYMGFMMDGGIEEMPAPQLQAQPTYKANSARPQGLDFGKIPVHLTPLKLKVQPIDAVPFYIGEGDVVANVGDPDYDISLSEDSDVPSLIWLREDNYLESDWARNFWDCKNIKQQVTFDDKILTSYHDVILQREFDMDNDSVVRTTVNPIRRGNNSPLKKYIKRHPSLVCKWVLTGGDIDLSAEFYNFNYVIETKITADEEEDGNDYPAMLQHHGEWILSNLSFDFLLKKGENSDLADLRSIIDKTTGSAVGDKMQLKVPRLHANDYLMFEFPNCLLMDYILPREQAKSREGPAYLRLLFGGHEDVLVQERQTDSAGSTNANNAATYEL